MVVGGAGWAWGLHPPQAPAARPPTAATHPRAWGRHRVSADEVYGAAQGGFQRPSSLRCVAAQDGGRREPQDHGEQWRRGPRREAWGVGARGEAGLGEGPFAGAACAASPRRPSPRHPTPPSPPGRSTPPQPSPLPVAAPVAGWPDGVGPRQRWTQPDQVVRWNFGPRQPDGDRQAPGERPRYRRVGQRSTRVLVQGTHYHSPPKEGSPPLGLG